MFSRMLTEYRERRRLNMTEFANAIGVSQPYIKKLETGEKKPPQKDTLYKIVSVLRLTPEEQDRFISAAIFERMPPEDQQMFLELRVKLCGGKPDSGKTICFDKDGEMTIVG